MRQIGLAARRCRRRYTCVCADRRERCRRAKITHSVSAPKAERIAAEKIRYVWRFFQEDKIIKGYLKVLLLVRCIFFKDSFDLLQQLVVFYWFLNEFFDRQPGIVPVII